MIEGRERPEGEYKYPVYARPPDAKLRAKTRSEIDFSGALSGRGTGDILCEKSF
ncbi:MAG: hypothetical protein HC902_09825 [Calothrix sp. SM1_5_4]|nr:hypothetical protein [Calothrix sp. SM1_5_4]